MPSFVFDAVELRLGEKCTRQLQYLVGTAQFLVLTLKRLDAFTLLGRDPIPFASVNSCFLTHSCRVWGVQPTLGASDSTVAHNEGYSLRCS